MHERQHLRGHAITAIRLNLNELATDLGRLRRRTDPETSAWWTTERMASRVEDIFGILEPTAAEIAAWTSGAAHLYYEGGGPNGYEGLPQLPGDDEAIDAAIAAVDQRHHRLRRQLGWPA